MLRKSLAGVLLMSVCLGVAWSQDLSGALGQLIAGIRGGALVLPAKSYAELTERPDGAVVYCRDCTVATPCGPGGTGAIGVQAAGGWRCQGSDGSWEPPLGIPAPGFGTTETAPARPSPWTSEQVGYYYVDAGTGTDSGRTYGDPTAPRATIPGTLAAGAYVEVHGTYSTNHSTPINCAGTSGSPCWIRGQSSLLKPTITSTTFYVGGSYTVLEHLDFRPTSGKWPVVLTTNGDLSRGDHLVFRANTLVGNGSNSGGMGVFDVAALGGQPSDVVIWNNTITDAGNYLNDTGDNDYHCVTTTYAIRVWVVDNVLARCEGDGLQITGTNLAPTGTHHIYAGRNITHSHKQNGLWSKYAQHVIFSQNVSYDNKASNSSDGACFGGQYQTDEFWIILNLCADSDYGILLGSDITGGLTLHTYIIGNLIYYLSDSAGVYAARGGDGYSNCGISMRNSGPKYVYTNTVYSSSGHGICVPGVPSNATLAVYNNILDTLHSGDGRHVYVDNAGMTIVSGGGLFVPNYSQNIGGTVTTLAAPQTLANNNLVRSTSSFVNVGAQNFRLNSDSAAVDSDTGTNVPAIYAFFTTTYSLSITANLDGTTRPASAYDAGAYER